MDVNMTRDFELHLQHNISVLNLYFKMSFDNNQNQNWGIRTSPKYVKSKRK